MSELTHKEFCQRFVAVFGSPGIAALGWWHASFFRAIILEQTGYPHLMLYGAERTRQKGIASLLAGTQSVKFSADQVVIRMWAKCAYTGMPTVVQGKYYPSGKALMMYGGDMQEQDELVKRCLCVFTGGADSEPLDENNEQYKVLHQLSDKALQQSAQMVAQYAERIRPNWYWSQYKRYYLRLSNDNKAHKVRRVTHVSLLLAANFVMLDDGYNPGYSIKQLEDEIIPGINY